MRQYSAMLGQYGQRRAVAPDSHPQVQRLRYVAQRIATWRRSPGSMRGQRSPSDASDRRSSPRRPNVNESPLPGNYSTIAITSPFEMRLR